MREPKTVNRSTVDTSDHDLVEPDAAERDITRRDVREPDAAERDITERAPVEPDAAERDITEREVREPDAAESETARERADMVGVAEPSDDARLEPEAPMAPDAARNVDEAADSQDAETAREVDLAPESRSDGAPVDESATTEEPGPDNAAELAPGDVPAPESTTLWAGEDSEALRERWREVQARFVDDPRGAAASADDLIGEVVESVTGALAAQRQQLGQWRAGGDFDTERLRVAVTGYRDFLDRVLSI